MKCAVLMDPISHLKLEKDTTIAMIQSAKKMGWTIVYFTTMDLFCRDGQAFARVSAIEWSKNDFSAMPDVSLIGEQALTTFDLILMRLDPPFNMEYIYATYALELAEKQGVLVVNKPQSLRDANEKFFTLEFPQCCPPTLVTKDMLMLRSFWEIHQNVIFKPLAAMGGSSVFHVDQSAQNLSVILEILTHSGSVTIMAQTYIPEIKQGDKRIIVIHGEPVEYGLSRIPAPGELRGNLAAGAQGKVVPLTERDRWICAQLAPTLLAKGLYFVGLDVIGNYLTEVNVTSPTCAREIMKETNIDITGRFLEGLHC